MVEILLIVHGWRMYCVVSQNPSERGGLHETNDDDDDIKNKTWLPCTLISQFRGLALTVGQPRRHRLAGQLQPNASDTREMIHRETKQQAEEKSSMGMNWPSRRHQERSQTPERNQREERDTGDSVRTTFEKNDRSSCTHPQGSATHGAR
ncbi:hypothetical protein VTO42DRAFT_689 [Malbranchea cinnamomea]